MNGRRVVLGSWLAIIALSTIRAATDPVKGGLPTPATFVASGVLFTMFYGGASFAPQLFGVLSVGVVVAAVFAPYLNAQGAIPASGPIFQLTKLISTASGTPAASTTTP